MMKDKKKRAPRREAKTEGGRFTIGGLAVGTAWIEIDSGEHEPLTEEFDLGPAPGERTYRLKKGGVIAGRVAEDGKAPAAEFEVTAAGPEPGPDR